MYIFFKFQNYLLIINIVYFDNSKQFWLLHVRHPWWREEEYNN